MLKGKNIIILGSRGMLGQMVDLFFKREGYNVIAFDERFTENNFISYVEKINEFDDSIVINCIGKIKQKSDDVLDLIWSNTILPLNLAKHLKPSHFLVHPSTDCVFDGKKGTSYNFNDLHTADDVYGWSKSLGETPVINRDNSLVMRVSIIGPDKNSSKGLLSWFLNNKEGAELNGFTDHLWNGITTLEWCKILNELVVNSENYRSIFKDKIVQLGTKEEYTKFEMLNIFQKVYGTDFKINSFETKNPINKCLNPMIISKKLEDQMIELKEFVDID